MLNGTIVFNGINDKQLRTLITVKIEHEGSLVFNPNLLQPQQLPREQIYNNAHLGWTGEHGLKAIKHALHALTESPE